MFTYTADLLRSYVDGRYFLKQLVRTAGDVSTFLALAPPDDSRVFLSLAPEESVSSSSWPVAVDMSSRHRSEHVLQYLDAGRAELEGQRYSYLVSEPVEEFVEDVLTQRTLTTDETESVLRTVLLALNDLHEHGYCHRGVAPEAVVAANGLVKLSAERLAPLGGMDESEARRARAGDLLAAGELATVLITRQTGPEAVLSLPHNLAEFVRATAGTSECPSPTPKQLLRLLDGEPLVPTIPDVRASTAAPAASAASVPLPIAAEQHPPQEQSFAPARRRGNFLVAIVGLIVITLTVVLSRRSAKVSAPVEPVTTPAPVAAPAPLPQTTSPPKRTAGPQKWTVIAATYSNYDAAAKRAAQLNSTRHHVSASVVPPKGEGPRYYVILGTASSRKEAERLKARASAAGLPRDTYVTRLQF